jgi:hypothetical protein
MKLLKKLLKRFKRKALSLDERAVRVVITGAIILWLAIWAYL